MKLEKALERDRKIKKRKNGMRIDGKSVFQLEQIKKEKAEAARREQIRKRKNGEDD